MHRLIAAISLSALSFIALSRPAAGGANGDLPWIKQSNVYTNMLLDVQLEHTPEQGSHEGLAKFDARISNPTLADDLTQRRELEAVLAKIKTAQPTVTDKNVQEDLDILQKAFDLQFRTEDFGLQHEVPFYNASSVIFQG